MADAAQLQLVVSAANRGDFDGAMTEARAIMDNETAAKAWRVLSNFNANMQRWGDARNALEIALQHVPGSPEIRLEIALLLGLEGRDEESLEKLEQLAREWPDSPQLLAHVARALARLGRPNEAESRIHAALARWPVEVSLHQLLAELRWQRGSGADCAAHLERAIERFPDALQLRLVAAGVLRDAGFAQRALELLEEGLRRAPGSVAFMTSVGVLLDLLDRPRDALIPLRDAASFAPGDAQVQRNLAAILLRLEHGADALAVCNTLLAASPEDQLSIAYQTTALRLLGDPRYERLCDYSRLVRAYRCSPPKGHEDIASFNGAFARELTSLHRQHQRPLAQSLRGGTQTDRNLPRDKPAVADFFSMIDAPIRDYVSRLESSSEHPTDRRKSSSYRIAGSWSVQLAPGGFHINHVHPQGWLSSAYYVDLPPIEEAGKKEGWIKFGEPGLRIPSLAADHHVKPEPGLLVLFPSFLWHGTVPFERGGRRLTAAFDVVPA